MGTQRHQIGLEKTSYVRALEQIALIVVVKMAFSFFYFDKAEMAFSFFVYIAKMAFSFTD